MATEFTFFEGATSVNATTPRVTVRKTGQLVLTEAAVAMLGEGVEAVQIGFDPKARAVGGIVGSRLPEEGAREADALASAPAVGRRRKVS